jgi:hypothetical protein
LIEASRRFFLKHRLLTYPLWAIPCVIGFWFLFYALLLDLETLGVKQIYHPIPISLFDPYWILYGEMFRYGSPTSWTRYFLTVASPLVAYVFVFALAARSKWYRTIVLAMIAVHLILAIIAYQIVKRPVLPKLW